MREIIYYNGDILTMDETLYVDAILIRNGLIHKIGCKDDILKFKNENTKVINLKGKTLMPSFIDSHSHLSALATTLGLVPLGDVTSIEELINKIKEFKNSKSIPKGKWIVGFGYDNNSLPNSKHPNKDILDKASIDNPIMISHASGHMGVLNSLALKKLGIGKDTTDPEGGVIGRVGNTNEPNGYLEENAFMQYSSKMDKPSLKSISKQIEEAQNIYLSYGITTAQEGIMKDAEFNLLSFIAENHKLKIDLVGYVDLKNSKYLMDNNEYLKKYVNRFKIGGYKIFLDGSPQGKTAWLTKPYENSADYRGYAIYNDKEVEDFVRTALDENIQLLTHCNGDAAADQLLNSFQDILGKGNSAKKIRPVIIHAQTVRYDQLDEMKTLDMIASFFVAHTYYWGDIHIFNLGEDRAFKISPLRSAIKKGVLYTLHQDSPVIAPNMLETVWAATNRSTKSGVIIGADERISPLEALKGVTINAAYQYFEEDKKGSITEGKLADLVILDKNPLKVDPMEIKNIQVLETLKEGKRLFKK
ncbi:amidohydrolase [Clostridium sp. LP20]|uniref:amidohydrolase n=1 Tax=Clostridium sp. LP20 TaxID=3418665 RepID=UPI003EE77688